MKQLKYKDHTFNEWLYETFPEEEKLFQELAIFLFAILSFWLFYAVGGLILWTL